MKSGLSTSRIYTADTIQADRIDEHLKLVGEQVNGGFTVQNLAVGTKLPNTAFESSLSIFTMVATANNQPAGTFLTLGTLNVNSTLIGIGWCIVVGQSTQYRTLSINSGVVVKANVYNLQSRQDLTSTNALCLYGSVQVGSYTVELAGTAFKLTWTLVAGEVMKGTVTTIWATGHKP